MLDQLKRIAGPTVKVLGPQPFSVLKQHYARCRALIFPGEEDFGMVPVEAMASGRPVIPYGKGGAPETVVANLSGVFLAEQTIEAICSAVNNLADLAIDPEKIPAHASRFGRE